MQFLAEIFLSLGVTLFPNGDHNIHFSAHIYGGKKPGGSKLRVEVSWIEGEFRFPSEIQSYSFAVL